MLKKFEQRHWKNYQRRMIWPFTLADLQISTYDDQGRLLRAGFKFRIFREYMEYVLLARAAPPIITLFIAQWLFTWVGPVAIVIVALLVMYSIWAFVMREWFDGWAVATIGFVFLRDGSVAFTRVDDLGFVHATEEPRMVPAAFKISDIRSIQAEPMIATNGSQFIVYQKSKTKAFVGHTVRVYLKSGIAIDFVKRLDLDTATLAVKQINEARREIADAIANEL